MQINSFLLSFLWVEKHLELLEREQPAEAPMKFLGRPETYAKEFDNAQHFLRLGSPLSLSPPWSPRTKGQQFWNYYCGGVTNANIRGTKAWQRLIPFHITLPLQFRTNLPISHTQLEIFFYPHSIAFAASITFYDKPEKSMINAIEAAFKLRFGRHYSVTWRGQDDPLYNGIIWREKPEATLSLEQLVNHGLSIARQLAYGKDTGTGSMTATEPFSVFTALGGKDIDLTKVPESNGEIQKILHAVTGWQKMRDGAAALIFDEKVNLGLGEEAGIADVLYGQRRGRAIWYPSRFLTNDSYILYGLRCYHRNIFFASLQTESLCGFAQAVTEAIRTGSDLSVYQRELASRAGGYLGLLFGGHEDTYRSFSPRRQIQDNEWIPEINIMRAYRGMSPLH